MEEFSYFRKVRKIRICIFMNDKKIIFTSPSHFIDAITIFFIAFCLVQGRWLSIVYPLPLNPDEVSFAANTFRITDYGYNWDATDGITSGPLNSAILLWPHIFALDVTLSSTRLTACVLLFLISTLVYFSIRISGKKWLAIRFLIPLIAFYSLTRHPDFLHYSSELLPTFLLVLANFIVLNLSSQKCKHHVLKLMLTGLFIGLVPFSKLQALPIAAFIGTYALFLALKSRREARLINILSLSFGLLLPVLFILCPLYLKGHFQDFWQSYIMLAIEYTTDPISISGIYQMINCDFILRRISYILIALWLIAIAYAAFVGEMRSNFKLLISANTIYLAILLLVVFWTIAKPGRLYTHYLMFFPPFFVVFLGVSLGQIYQFNSKQIAPALDYIFLTFLLVIGIGFYKGEFKVPLSNYETVLKQKFLIKNPELLSWLPSSNKRLLIWGWMPQWYLWTNYTPATRETNTEWQIANTSLTSYYRSRFIKDFKKSNPDVLIDAVAGKSFGFNNNKYSPNIFPAFSAILSESYFQLSPMVTKHGCAKLYVKNNLKELLHSKLVLPKTIDVTATYGGDSSEFSKYNLFDYSFTEDTCTDYWLLPDFDTGSLSIGLSNIELISSFMILNTKNSHGIDRSTKWVAIKFKLKDKVVLTQKIKLKPHPFWTVIDFSDPVIADIIVIEVISFNGKGAGLNEIKILRQ
jgi:hypothetical protein